MESFDSILRNLRKKLFAFAMRLTADRTDAEDLLQESLVRALNAWPRFVREPDDAGRVASWLHTIIKNTFITEYHRRTHVRTRSSECEVEIVVATMGGEATALPLPGTGLSDEVEAALATLDEDQRECVLRCDFHDQPYNVIAEETGVPIGTVMSRIFRGRKRLKLALAGYARDAYRIREVPGSPRGGFARGTGKIPVLLHAAEDEQAEADGVHGIVARDDGDELRVG